LDSDVTGTLVRKRDHSKIRVTVHYVLPDRFEKLGIFTRTRLRLAPGNLAGISPGLIQIDDAERKYEHAIQIALA
jgi:hypothetical protein